LATNRFYKSNETREKLNAENVRQWKAEMEAAQFASEKRGINYWRLDPVGQRKMREAYAESLSGGA
jgi:hypothetical protein